MLDNRHFHSYSLNCSNVGYIILKCVNILIQILARICIPPEFFWLPDTSFTLVGSVMLRYIRIHTVGVGRVCVFHDSDLFTVQWGGNMYVTDYLKTLV